MGDDVSPYMHEMMLRQGQQPKGPWTFVEQLRKQYEVVSVPTDANDINDIDILLVVHPKDLSEQTLFAIDQFVLKGGRMIAFVDPHCFADKPDQRMMQMGMQVSRSSELNALLKTWGIEMPVNTFAGDLNLAAMASIRANQRPERIIGYLNLTPEGKCFDKDNVITTQLNQVRLLFSGVLREVADPNEEVEVRRTPLVTTTDRGNSFSISNAYELMILDPSNLMSKFMEGDKPVAMSYLITGRLKSSFPEGVEIEVEADEESSDETKDPNDVKKIKKRIKGLTEAQEDCAVVVFADVDFISDSIAYQSSFFGKMVVGDNSALVLNTIDDLSGSGDLVSIRSRGNFKRPFVVVDEIERRAEEETREEVMKINAQIAGFQSELQSILASAKKGQEEVIGSSILQKQRDLELKQRRAQRQLNEVKLTRRERIEHLGNILRGFNMLMAPVVILIIAIVLGIRRGVRKRHYISQVMLEVNPKFEIRNTKQTQMTKIQNSKRYDLEERTLEFAKRVRAFVKKLKKTIANIEDGRQLVKASGSVGGNYIEANEALSKKDFVMRIKICRKEAKESGYWLKLVDNEDDTELERERHELIQEATELTNIFGSILRKSE
jgi:four helix bundle protein